MYIRRADAPVRTSTKETIQHLSKWEKTAKVFFCVMAIGAIALGSIVLSNYLNYVEHATHEGAHWEMWQTLFASSMVCTALALTSLGLYTYYHKKRSYLKGIEEIKQSSIELTELKKEVTTHHHTYDYNTTFCKGVFIIGIIAVVGFSIGAYLTNKSILEICWNKETVSEGALQSLQIKAYINLGLAIAGLGIASASLILYIINQGKSSRCEGKLKAIDEAQERAHKYVFFTPDEKEALLASKRKQTRVWF